MILGTAIFPGKDLVDQLSLILGKLNGIAEADFSHFRQDRAKLVERQIKVKPVATAQAEIMGCGRESGTELAVDLVMRLLTIDPKRRMTVEEAVQHEYISKSSYVLPEVGRLCVWIVIRSLSQLRHLLFSLSRCSCPPTFSASAR